MGANLNIIGQKLSVFVATKHRKILSEAVLLLKTTNKKSVTVELQILASSQKPYWHALTIQKISKPSSSDEYHIYATNINTIKLREEKLLAKLLEKDKTIEALQGTYQTHEAIINNSNSIIVIVDHKERILNISKFTADLIGYKLHELLGKDALNTFVPPKLYPEFYKEVKKLRKLKGFPEPFEGILHTKYGEKKIISWTTKPLIVGGKNLGRVSIGRDITDVKFKEQELIEKEQRFKRIAENIPLPVSICNTNGETVFLNKKFFEVIGYTIEEVPTLLEAYQHIYYPSNALAELGQKEWASLFEAFVAGNNAAFPVIERIITCKDGKMRHFEMSFSMEEKLLYAVYNDITEKVLHNAELQKQKNFYETILNSIPSDIAVFDNEHRYLFVNPVGIKDAVLRKWLVGKTDEDYCNYRNKPLSIAEGRRKLFNDVKTSKQLKKWEEPLYKDYGEIEYHLRNMYPIIDDDGEVSMIIGYGVDVSNLKKAEQKLFESEQRFKNIADNTPISICNFDREMNITYINKKFLEISGYSFEDVASANAWPHFIYYPDKQSTELGRTEWIAAIESKWVNPNFNIQPLERTIICKNGEHKVFEISFSVHNKLIYAILNEVTEKKRAEKMLFESEQRFKALAENMPIAIGSHHIDGEVMFLNKFFLETIGYTNSDIPTLEQWYNHTQPDPVIRKSLYNHWLETVAAYRNGTLQHIPNIETSVLCKNGQLKNFSFLFSIYKDIVYIMLVDITERKKAENELISSHLQLRELASHLQKIREDERKRIAREIHDELGQLITGLKMDISITKRKIEKSLPDLGDKLAGIMDITDDIIHTVRRIASELRPSILDDIGLDAALEWQAKEFEKRTNIVCIFNNEAKDVVVSMDVKSNLFRIFQESLTNIIRHANATKVVASLSIKNGILLFSICDNGHGLKQKTNNRTFGLLGMKERVIMINGEFDITSAPNKGTSIVVKVPLH